MQCDCVFCEEPPVTISGNSIQLPILIRFVHIHARQSIFAQLICFDEKSTKLVVTEYPLVHNECQSLITATVKAFKELNIQSPLTESGVFSMWHVKTSMCAERSLRELLDDSVRFLPSKSTVSNLREYPLCRQALPMTVLTDQFEDTVSVANPAKKRGRPKKSCSVSSVGSSSSTKPPSRANENGPFFKGYSSFDKLSREQVSIVKKLSNRQGFFCSTAIKNGPVYDIRLFMTNEYEIIDDVRSNIVWTSKWLEDILMKGATPFLVDILRYDVSPHRGTFVNCVFAKPNGEHVTSIVNALCFIKYGHLRKYILEKRLPEVKYVNFK